MSTWPVFFWHWALANVINAPNKDPGDVEDSGSTNAGKHRDSTAAHNHMQDVMFNQTFFG